MCLGRETSSIHDPRIKGNSLTLAAWSWMKPLRIQAVPRGPDGARLRRCPAKNQFTAQVATGLLCDLGEPDVSTETHSSVHRYLLRHTRGVSSFMEA